MGAFGAHALKETLRQRDTTQVRYCLLRHKAIEMRFLHHSLQSWHTATQYQLMHSVALLSLHAMSKQGKTSSQYDLVAKLWISGTVLFSGSIYGLCLGGPRLLGPVTPLGGLLLLAGWAAFGISASQSS
jgi:uncharacterized membrane protein YgdD (TMEM256/DUF423 family)